jgi:hypothetical protein
MHIRPVHGRVAAGTPTPALSQSRRMRNVADIYFTRRSLDLCMTLQAKI